MKYLHKLNFSQFQLVGGLVLGGMGMVMFPFPVIAQIKPEEINTTNTTVIKNGDDFTINDGNHVGNNLFHSFDEFSVPKGGSAFFNNAADVINILSRVTGGAESVIEGLIKANGNANLFLLNPAGITFKNGATLDIGGSFTASTADAIELGEDGLFSASDPNASNLLGVNPSALFYNAIRQFPGAITNQSVAENSIGEVVGLEVEPGKNITLVGGNINFIAGKATAIGGRIELGGLSEAGTVTFNNDGSLNDGSLSFPEDVAKADITLRNAAEVDVRGRGGGTITINARNLKVEGESGRSLVRAGIKEDSTSANAKPGDITINATDTISMNQGSKISNEVNQDGVGDSGDIIITTGSLNLTSGAQVVTGTHGKGNAGKVTIHATDSISLDGEDLRIHQDTPLQNRKGASQSALNSIVAFTGEGKSGGIEIKTGSLSLTKGAAISSISFGVGNAGDIIINADNNITFDGETKYGNNFTDSLSTGAFSLANFNNEGTAKGKSGGIEINTRSLSLTNGGVVNSRITIRGIVDNRAGNIRAGNIIVNATESIFINGESKKGKKPSGLFAGAFEGNGNGGRIQVNTDKLTIDNKGAIEAGNFDPTLRYKAGTGIPGAIKVIANSLSLNNEARIEAVNIEAVNQSQKNEAVNIDNEDANIDIEVADNIKILNESSISAKSLYNADGGNINITLKGSSPLYINNSEISASNETLDQEKIIAFKDSEDKVFDTILTEILNSTESGTAGSIKISANTLELEDNSEISTNAQRGGEIQIDSSNLLGSRNSDIVATKGGEFDPGRVSIDADVVLGLRPRENRTSLSDVIGDTVEFNSPDSDQIVTSEQEEPIEVSSLIDRRCAIASNENVSSFTVVGQGGLPPNLQDSLSVPGLLPDFGLAEPFTEKAELSNSNINYSLVTLPNFGASTWKFPGICLGSLSKTN